MTLAEFLSEQARINWDEIEAGMIRQSVVDSAKQLRLTLRIAELEMKLDGWCIKIFVIEKNRSVVVQFAFPVCAVDEDWYTNEIMRQLQERLQ